MNGAFNPGNSGGPLFRAKDNKVIGVVVAKFHLYPPMVMNAIKAMGTVDFGIVHHAKDAQGNPVDISESKMMSLVLEQFYKTTQVMIGEAISVSELRAFLRRKDAELR